MDERTDAGLVDAGSIGSARSLAQLAGRWRCIGPYRGGRVVAVAGDPEHQLTFYFGACAGGVWKSVDGGAYWHNVSDGQLKTAAVGALAVAPSDPRRLYAGTGESQIRVDVTHGDGVYRSDDAGATWRSIGLGDTRHIARIRVHPADPDTLYVAAIGLAFGDSQERGVYRSHDGGQSWDRVLFTDPGVGACDLSMDPTRPQQLFAPLWQFRRAPWGISSGGPLGGLHRTNDGGESWTELTARPGLPARPWGRVGVAASPTSRGRLWALIEAEAGGLYRSEDDGESWQLLNDSADLREKPFYFSHVFAHPTDGEEVWVLAKKAHRSRDGGRTFDVIDTPHTDDHDLWIDPANPQRLIEGNDGGACVSLNGGETWSSTYNQPTGQFYRLTVDRAVPYRVYGTQQDSSAVRVPSDSIYGGIRWADCETVGSAESGSVVVDPFDAETVYSGATGSSPGGGLGAIMRFDGRTRQVRMVSPVPDTGGTLAPAEQLFRFVWSTPIVCSRHVRDLVYVGGNVVFRSADRGERWQVISPDLTTDDQAAQQRSGGPITAETAADVACAITALAESPMDARELWAGTDDGRVHVTQDDGASWREVTPPDMKRWSAVLSIELSPHRPGSAYLAATRYRMGDNRPLMWRTADGGDSWQMIAGGIPPADFTRVLRCDSQQAGLLYAGTETTVYVSPNDGASWEQLNAGLPVAPVYDLCLGGPNGRELVVATHGRAFWVLDQLDVLRQATAAGGMGATEHRRLLAPQRVMRHVAQAGWDPWPGPVGAKTHGQGSLGVDGTFALEAEPGGRQYLDEGTPGAHDVRIVVRLDPGDPPLTELRIHVRDAAGQTIATMPVAPESRWDVRYPSLESGISPLVPPGVYSLVLMDGEGRELDHRLLTVDKHPSARCSDDDLREQARLLLSIRDRVAAIQAALPGLASRPAERRLHRVVPNGDVPRNHPPGILERLTALATVVGSGDGPPTAQERDAFDRLAEASEAALTAP